MTLGDRIRETPMTWKDWVTAMGIAITLGAVLLQGGRMLEQLATANRQLAELSGQLHALRSDLNSTRQDITALRGRDELHDEQIRSLRRDFDDRGRR